MSPSLTTPHVDGLPAPDRVSDGAQAPGLGLEGAALDRHRVRHVTGAGLGDSALLDHSGYGAVPLIPRDFR
jgi:hypothetical protein